MLVGADTVLRVVGAAGSEEFRAAHASGLLRDLVQRGDLVPYEEIERPNGIEDVSDARHVLSHPRLGLISYPYEWPFALWRKAALFHLKLQVGCLNRGFTLSDATAYNVQFVGVRPVFIDHLSFIRYQDGDIWTAHRQFCVQFLCPLVLASRLGVRPNGWFRGNLDGIEIEDMVRLIPWHAWGSFTLFTHLVLQARLQRREGPAAEPHKAARRKARLPREALLAMLRGLLHFIESLKPPRERTVWSEYAGNNSYTAQDAAAKRALVGEMVSRTAPRHLWDVGCNTGDFALLALSAGAGSVTGWDFDHGALDRAVERAEHAKGEFLPLWLDAANPSPCQGWMQRERLGLQERAGADALLALALLHHLVLHRSIPMDDAVAWLIGLAPTGIIEFPSASDPMVQRLTAGRRGRVHPYDLEGFLAAVRRRARIVREERLEDGDRTLVWYDRNGK